MSGNPFGTGPLEGMGSGGGAGVSGLDTADGGTALADNVIVRGDGATGIQGSDITIADASGSSVAVATTAGNALAVSATAPAAAAGASQTGKNVSITASAAVASTDTAGAAAGGAVTITGGAAARLTSGNANGGGITLTPGAGIGTGVAGNVSVSAGQLLAQTGSLALPGIAFASATNSGLRHNNSCVAIVENGVEQAAFDDFNRGVKLPDSGRYQWSSAATPSGLDVDTALLRKAAGVIAASGSSGTGTSVSGWLMQAGNKRVTANQTVTDSDTLASSTDLTVTVAAGRSYTFRAELPFTTVNTSGVKVAIAGTATHTDILYDVVIHGISTPGFLTSGRAASAGTAVGVTASGTAARATITGTTTVNAGGTLLVQFAQNAETGAAESVILLRGGSFDVIDVA